MSCVRLIQGPCLWLDSGRRIRLPGPIADVRLFEGVLCVLLAWRSGPRRAATARVRLDNAYGYDLRGARRWRAVPLPGDDLGNVFTAFVESVPSLMLHEARGWHMLLDPGTGSIAGLDRVT